MVCAVCRVRPSRVSRDTVRASAQWEHKQKSLNRKESNFKGFQESSLSINMLLGVFGFNFPSENHKNGSKNASSKSIVQ